MFVMLYRDTWRFRSVSKVFYTSPLCFRTRLGLYCTREASAFEVIFMMLKVMELHVAFLYSFKRCLLVCFFKVIKLVKYFYACHCKNKVQYFRES